MNILITGTSGFLGGATCRHLSHKHTIFSLSSFNKFQYLSPDDCFTKRFIKEKLKPDILINFAWGGGSNNKDLNSIEQFDNIKTCIDLFNLGVECGVKRFIQVSSSWEFYYHYGVTEYGLSKYFTNRILSRMAQLSDVKFSRIVPYWIYGPNDRENRFIPSIIKKCLKNEKIELHPAQNIVDYLFIDDFVEAVGLIIEKGNGLSYSICSKRGYKVQDIVEKINLLTNSKSDITYNKEYPKNFNMEWVGDNSEIKRLGWAEKSPYGRRIKENNRMAQEFNNQIIFSTYCEDHLQERFGTHKLKKTFEYFNPNYKLVVLGTKEIQEIHKKYNVDYSNALPVIMLETKRKYNSEYICHIDSDSLCLGRLDEILKFDYEIASCKNNTDQHTGDERQNRPKCLWDLLNHKYVNCGLTATNSEKFLLEWIELNRQVTEKYGGIKAFWQADIQWFNYLFHYGGYKSKTLDETGANMFYGPSANFDSSNNYVAPSITKEYGGNFKNWSSWYDIEFKDNKFYINNKEVKILHKGGGGMFENNDKMHLDLFNKNTATILKKITK